MSSSKSNGDLSFDDILTTLKTPSSSSIFYKNLCAIRKLVEWPKHKGNINKFHNSGHLKQIVLGLRSSKLHTVSVTLSILGNCCMDSKCTNEIIFHYNVLWELNQVLKKYPKEDGVNGRVFRIIGNMCQHRTADIILSRKPQLVSYIVEFIQKYAEAENEDDSFKFSEATIVMGVRALRQLLNGRTFVDLVKMGYLKSIGTLLIKCGDNWILHKKDHNILENIIRLLLQVSRYKYYQGIIELRNTPKGDSLVHLSRILLLSPKKIVKIIMNLIKTSQLKSDLPIPEICSAFVKLLNEQPDNQCPEEEYRDYITCLCYLLEHPANRNPNRCRETVPQLIKILGDFENSNEKTLDLSIMIVNTLDKCSFHEPLVKEQLEANIVEVLVKKIEWLISDNSAVDHKLQRKRKVDYCKQDALNNSDSFNKKFGFSLTEQLEIKSPFASSDDEFDWFTPSGSGGGSGSGSESDCLVTSPWSSPSSSPNRQSRGRSSSPLVLYPDLSDSEDYSPVCSDFEEDEPNLCNKDDTSSVEIERASECDDEDEEKTNVSLSSFKYRLLNSILTLLKTYTVLQPSPIELCSESLLLVLIKCCHYFDYGSITTHLAMTLISRILQIHDYLIPLMQTEVISTVYSLLKTQHGMCCVKCNQIEQIGAKILSKFSNLAESGCGRGDIANRLILGNDEIKKQLVLVIPYIIRNKRILNSFMLKCGGLQVLIKLLQDISAQKKTIKVMCALASDILKISNPRQCSSAKEKVILSNIQPSHRKNIVTFVLDDNSRLKADRDFLCEKSCFFNTLLNGSFKESKENLINLHQVDREALESLIGLMAMDYDKKEIKEVQLDTKILLDVITLCDRYLLEDLCVYLTECVQQCRLNADNIPLIYRWALESKTNILRIESIAFSLVGDIKETERFHMFEKLFRLGYSDEIMNDIRELIVRYLNLY